MWNTAESTEKVCQRFRTDDVTDRVEDNKRYLRETLHGTNQEDHVFHQVRHSHPELPEVIRVLRDSVLNGESNVSVHIL